MKEKIIHYWQNLQIREKKILLAGGFFLILFLLYLLVDAGAVRNIRMAQTLEKEQKLLTWMQPVVGQIVMMRTQKKGEPVTTKNILAQVEFSLEEVGLSGQIVALNLVEGNQVRIEFNDVVYEALVKWLYAFSQQGARVHDFMATKTDKVGVVQASVLLGAE
jgi:type II secretory pathway component PulM